MPFRFENHCSRHRRWRKWCSRVMLSTHLHSRRKREVCVVSKWIILILSSTPCFNYSLLYPLSPRQLRWPIWARWTINSWGNCWGRLMWCGREGIGYLMLASSTRSCWGRMRVFYRIGIRLRSICCILLWRSWWRRSALWKINVNKER